jgi:hypothetical protein
MKQDKKPERIVIHRSATLPKPDFSQPEKLKQRFTAEPRYAEVGGLNEEAIATIHAYIDSRAALLKSRPPRPVRRNRPPVDHTLPPITVSFPTLDSAKDFGSDLGKKLEAQMQRESSFRRANGYSKEDVKQYISNDWIEHDILDAQLDLEKPPAGGILLISRQRDKRYALQLLSRRITSVS